MGRPRQTGTETLGRPGIYAHRSLDQASVPDFERVQAAIDLGRGRCRKRSTTSAGVSLITSSRMNRILGVSPELNGLDPDDLASKMRSSITTGVGSISIGVTGVEVIEAGVCNYLVAAVRKHPDVLKDHEDLVRTLRGLGGVGLGGDAYDPHVTFAAFYGNVPRQAVEAAEASMPTSFTVGCATVDVVPSIRRAA